jgi:hypothetical protein
MSFKNSGLERVEIPYYEIHNKNHSVERIENTIEPKQQKKSNNKRKRKLTKRERESIWLVILVMMMTLLIYLSFSL